MRPGRGQSIAWFPRLTLAFIFPGRFEPALVEAILGRLLDGLGAANEEPLLLLGTVEHFRRRICQGARQRFQCQLSGRRSRQRLRSFPEEPKGSFWFVGHYEGEGEDLASAFLGC